MTTQHTTHASGGIWTGAPAKRCCTAHGMPTDLLIDLNGTEEPMCQRCLDERRIELRRWIKAQQLVSGGLQ